MNPYTEAVKNGQYELDRAVALDGSFDGTLLSAQSFELGICR